MSTSTQTPSPAWYALMFLKPSTIGAKRQAKKINFRESRSSTAEPLRPTTWRLVNAFKGRTDILTCDVLKGRASPFPDNDERQSGGSHRIQPPDPKLVSNQWKHERERVEVYVCLACVWESAVV